MKFQPRKRGIDAAEKVEICDQMFSRKDVFLHSSFVSAGQSYSVMLYSNQQQAQTLQAHQLKSEAVVLTREEQNTQLSGQLFRAPTVNSSSMDGMFKVATVVQQIVTQLMVLCQKKIK